MTPQLLATQLHGLDNRRIPRDLQQVARDHQLVIVIGGSDDLIDFYGAISDQVGAYDGGTAYFTAEGLYTRECECRECPHEQKIRDSAIPLHALWEAEPGYSWTYKTDIPHATFDLLSEGENWCRGLVFSLTDLARFAATREGV